MILLYIFFSSSIHLKDITLLLLYFFHMGKTFLTFYYHFLSDSLFLRNNSPHPPLNSTHQEEALFILMLW